MTQKHAGMLGITCSLLIAAACTPTTDVAKFHKDSPYCPQVC